MQIRELDPRTASDGGSADDPPDRGGLLARAARFVSEELSLANLPVLVGRRSALVARGRRRRGGADDHAAVVQLCAGARASRSAPPGNRHGAARGSRRLGASTGHRVACSRTTPTTRAPHSRGAPGAVDDQRDVHSEVRLRDVELPEPPLPGGWQLLSWIGPAPEELVESYAAARAAIDDAPTPGDMTMEPIDVAWVRRMEATAALASTRVAGHRRGRRGRCRRLVHRPARLAAAVRRSRRRTTRRRSPGLAAWGSPTPSSSSLCGDCAPSARTWRSSAP